jgi:hypothetical protein
MWRFVSLLPMVLLGLSGCSFPSGAVRPPKIDPPVVASAAIEQYDQNDDQELTGDEIKTSALNLERWDADKNGSIGEAEIQERLEKYLATKVGLIDVVCFVRNGNRPLAGAEVEFEPEELLGGAVHSAYGTTEDDGSAVMAISEEHRLNPNLFLVQVGLYNVRITHPDLDIRAEFNTDTKLSYEVSPLEELVPPIFRVRE